MQPVQELTDATVARARLRSLLLTGDGPQSFAGIATWFGAMQAQDVASGKWSLGVRVTGSQEADVDAAFENAELVRTWPMRGTIHIVPAQDIRWMLALTGIRALDASRTRRAQLGFDEAEAQRGSSVLETALRERGRLTRAQCLDTLQQAGISTDGQRGYHLLGYAAHTGLICIGPNLGTEQTFVLIDEWAPTQVALTRDEALAELAFRYFRSHGPAPLRDFTGWTGLTLTDGRAALRANDGRLVARGFRGEDVWLTAELARHVDDGSAGVWSAAAALPGFDEFVLGYKDRTVQIIAADFDRIVPGGNGVFRPTLCLDGRAVGTWTRAIKRTEVVVDFAPFRPLNARDRKRAAAAFAPYAAYLGRDLRLG